ncbi:aldo/keto reductase [Mycolicibacterium fallax]|uniref:2,5-diketo-D-gluconic acid reductase n=1 Tax=Mycolicibacterium fallax TaxID=1793 RepID=A0A1X1RI93_MYCFA|nr:aldo/keto reductase [Mycolicibacterium fallax]ORV06795.1 2,5-diketo-D-gluconic acid reductase [Mycolicibacterium fallax]BBY96765.1 putative oxidoreductase [Mycolicibacterium fallax]
MSGTTAARIELNDGNTMPVLGLGVGGLSESEAERAVSAALEHGYRLIDTAASYHNEAGVGRAIAASGIAREELFITSKLANADQGFQSSQDGCKASLDALGLDYLDLYLVHWPAAANGKYVDSFAGLLGMRSQQLTRSVGVANFTAEYLSKVIKLVYTVPAVNQIELHPLLNQSELRALHAERGIVTEAYSPLGVGQLLDNAVLTAIAADHGRTPAQVALRWNLQLGNVVIPRSVSAERIEQNFAVFDFELSEAEMDRITALSDGTRYRPDPVSYTGP